MIGQSYMDTSRKRKRQFKSSKSKIPKLPRLLSTNFGPLHQQLTTLVASIRAEEKLANLQLGKSIEIVESSIAPEESIEIIESSILPEESIKIIESSILPEESIEIIESSILPEEPSETEIKVGFVHVFCEPGAFYFRLVASKRTAKQAKASLGCGNHRNLRHCFTYATELPRHIKFMMLTILHKHRIKRRDAVIAWIENEDPSPYFEQYRGLFQCHVRLVKRDRLRTKKRIINKLKD
jgi:hypothetical protein